MEVISTKLGFTPLLDALLLSKKPHTFALWWRTAQSVMQYMINNWSHNGQIQGK